MATIQVTQPGGAAQGYEQNKMYPTYDVPTELRNGNRGPVPQGLSYLAQVDQLIVKQQVELLEVLTGFETNNKYRIFNSMGQQVYFAAEETSCLMRQCCGPNRGFTIHITDNLNQEVMRVTREFKCCAGCSWCACSDCCAFVIQVESPPGTPIGYVKQGQSCWSPTLHLLDEHQAHVATLRGPCCVCNLPCCGDIDFPVSAGSGTEIGTCAKQWSGLLLEMFTDADTFSVRFSLDLDVKVKATMMAALFLLDFMFFEESNNDNNN